MGLVAFDASRRFGTGGIGDEDLRAFVARWLVCLLDEAIGVEVRRDVPTAANTTSRSALSSSAAWATVPRSSVMTVCWSER